jgi:hypothetical protein
MQNKWVLLEKLTVADPDGNFAGFYKIQIFSTLFTTTLPSPAVSLHANKFSPCHLVYFKIYFNIILSYKTALPCSPVLSDSSIQHAMPL